MITTPLGPADGIVPTKNDLKLGLLFFFGGGWRVDFCGGGGVWTYSFEWWKMKVGPY